MYYIFESVRKSNKRIVYEIQKYLSDSYLWYNLWYSKISQSDSASKLMESWILFYNKPWISNLLHLIWRMVTLLSQNQNMFKKNDSENLMCKTSFCVPISWFYTNFSTAVAVSAIFHYSHEAFIKILSRMMYMFKWLVCSEFFLLVHTKLKRRSFLTWVCCFDILFTSVLYLTTCSNIVVCRVRVQCRKNQFKKKQVLTTEEAFKTKKRK